MSNNKSEPIANTQPSDLNIDIERLQRQILSLEEAHRKRDENMRVLKKTVKYFTKRAGKFDTKMLQTDSWLKGVKERVGAVEEKLRSVEAQVAYTTVFANRLVLAAIQPAPRM